MDPNLLAVLILGSILAMRTPAMLRQPGPPRALWVALLALESAEILQLDPVADALGSALEVPGVARIAKHALIVVAAGGVHALLTSVRSGPRRPLWRQPYLLLAAAAIAGLGAPFLTFGATAPEVVSGVGICLTHSQAALCTSTRLLLAHRTEGTARYDSLALTSLLIYWNCFLGYLLWALVSATRLCWTFGRQAPSGPTRTGLVLIGAGTTVGFAFATVKIAVLWSWSSGSQRTLLGDHHEEGAVLLVLLVLIGVGSGYEALHTHVGRLRSTRAALRSMRRLYPLWQVVLECFPGQVMFPQDRVAPLVCRVETARYLQLRRRAEIQDGIRLLAPYVGEDQREAARDAARVVAHQRSQPGRLEVEGDPLALAACLHAGRAARLRGDAATDGNGPLRLPSRSGETETALLERVAAAYVSLPARLLGDQLNEQRASPANS